MTGRMSAQAMAAAYAENSDEAWAMLLTITHADIAGGVLRLTDKRNDVVSGGDTFYATCPFRIILPDQDGDKPQRAVIRIEDLDGTAVYQQIWTLDPPPKVTIEFALLSTPDTIEGSTIPMDLVNIKFMTDGTLEGELSPLDLTKEPYPAGTFSPADFPGLF